MWRNLARLARYRGLIQSLVGRELKARYRGSVFGFLWSFFNPLLLLLVYTFVFTLVLASRADSAPSPYAVFMFCGLLPWTWFSTSLLESTNSLIAGGNLIKKVLFPAEVLPIVAVLANMAHFGFGLVILIGFLVVTPHPVDPAGLIWFPVVVLVQLVLTMALALPLAAIAVHFRDLRDLLSNLLTFWFFATPIIYSYQMPEVARLYWLFQLNPFYHLAVSYQEILFFPGPFGHAKWLLVLGGLSMVALIGGYFVFDRLRDSFAEAV